MTDLIDPFNLKPTCGHVFLEEDMASHVREGSTQFLANSLEVSFPATGGLNL